MLNVNPTFHGAIHRWLFLPCSPRRFIWFWSDQFQENQFSIDFEFWVRPWSLLNVGLPLRSLKSPTGSNEMEGLLKLLVFQLKAFRFPMGTRVLHNQIWVNAIRVSPMRCHGHRLGWHKLQSIQIYQMIQLCILNPQLLPEFDSNHP